MRHLSCCLYTISATDVSRSNLSDLEQYSGNSFTGWQQIGAPGNIVVPETVSARSGNAGALIPPQSITRYIFQYVPLQGGATYKYVGCVSG